MCVDTALAALIVIVEGGAAFAKIGRLSGVLGTQVGIVALIVTNGRDDACYQIPPRERDSLNLLFGDGAAL